MDLGYGSGNRIVKESQFNDEELYQSCSGTSGALNQWLDRDDVLRLELQFHFKNCCKSLLRSNHEQTRLIQGNSVSFKQNGNGEDNNNLSVNEQAHSRAPWAE